MEDGLDSAFSQELDRVVPLFERRQNHVERMVVAHAVTGDDRSAQKRLLLSRTKGVKVMIEDLPSSVSYSIHHFQLSTKKGARYFAGNVGRADFNPGILVHFASKESTTIGSLLPNDLRSIDQVGGVYT